MFDIFCQFCMLVSWSRVSIFIVWSKYIEYIFFSYSYSDKIFIAGCAGSPAAHERDQRGARRWDTELLARSDVEFATLFRVRSRRRENSEW